MDLSIVLPNILANRLLISVRAAYYDSPKEPGLQLTSLHFDHRKSLYVGSHPNRNQSHVDREMETFNERVGV
jgi:hypothetical protein